MSRYGYGAPGSIVLGPDVGANAIPAVPLDLPKPLFRYGEQSIWSTALLSNATNPANSVIRTFSTPIGQTGQNFQNPLSISETNLKEGGRIPAGVAYDVFGIALQVLTATTNESSGTPAKFNGAVDTTADIQDLLNVLNNTVVSWDFTQTSVDVSPALLVGAGGGAFGAVSQNAAGSNTGHMNNGAGSIWLYRKYPVALPANSTFGVILRIGNRTATIGSNDLGLRVVLMGYYKNVIEIG
jgi:hypothetical protein